MKLTSEEDLLSSSQLKFLGSIAKAEISKIGAILFL